MDRIAEVVNAIRTRDRGGDPERLAMKYQAMRGDAFAFFRATCGLYYFRLAGLGRLPPAPPAWTCGDLHLENFGYFSGGGGKHIFGANDFDEALLAPAFWDAMRCVSSLYAARKLLNLDKRGATAATGDFVRDFAAALSAPPDTERGDGENARPNVEADREALKARTEMHGGKRRLLLDGDHALPASVACRRAVRSLLADLAAQNPAWASLRVLDVARRVAGLGSLGVERYSVLASGGPCPEPEWLIDLKGARPPASAPSCPLPQPPWPSEAARVATIEKAAEPAALDYLTVAGRGAKALILRKLRPREARVKVGDLGVGGRLRGALRRLARAAAAVQANTAGSRAAADRAALAAFAGERGWPAVVAEVAVALAKENKGDWRAFSQAYDAGAFEVARQDVASERKARK